MRRMAELRMLAAAAVCAVFFAACRTGGAGAQIVQPGAPGEASQVITAEQAADRSRVRHTDADIRFMQRMIGHHAQALDMARLVGARTARDAIRKLALRIELSQADEITMMEEWLRRRGAALPNPHAHLRGVAMPGMLTPEEMTRLAEAHGPAFDRLFLELMIKHHAGALAMVEELFSQPGAGQESEIFAFASDVDADQRMEMQRMAAMLEELQ